jgi:hemerythrin-like domain-containing protein
MTAVSAPRPSFDSATTYLTWDHDRLSALLGDVTLRVDGGEAAVAVLIFRDFDRELARHIRIEEEILFPLFEARSGVVAGPTAAFRREHEEILRAVEVMREALEAADLERFRDGLRFFMATFPDHTAREEHLLYPTTDGMLSEPERRVVSERLQRE